MIRPFSLPTRSKAPSTKKSRAAKSAKAAERGWLRRSLPSIATVGVSLLIVAGIGLLPAKTWLNQRDTTVETQQNLDRVNAQVAELENQLRLLETDDEIERTARENFDLVYPGEESYRILPAPKAEPVTPAEQPAVNIEVHEGE